MDKIKIVFATNNSHKLSEIKAILGTDFDILSLKDINCNVDIPETSDTIEGNASLKSHYVWEHYHLDCFSDDTGLEVDFLNGEPGVHSARYADGKDHDSKANIDKLLKKLGNTNMRNARFRTVISLIVNGQEIQFEGIINGTIAKKLSGTGGFGYDPIFIPNGYNESFADLGENVKNKISHRSLAVTKLANYLIILQDRHNKTK